MIGWTLIIEVIIDQGDLILLISITMTMISCWWLHWVAVGQTAGLCVVRTEGSAHLLLEPECDHNYHYYYHYYHYYYHCYHYYYYYHFYHYYYYYHYDYHYLLLEPECDHWLIIWNWKGVMLMIGDVGWLRKLLNFFHFPPGALSFTCLYPRDRILGSCRSENKKNVINL